MTVLACIDRSRYAAAVCEYSARAALRLSTDVELLHVIARESGVGDETPIDRSGRMTFDMADATLEEFARLNETRRRLEQERAHRWLDLAATRVRDAGVATVRQRVAFGSLVDQLHQYPQNRLVVLGRRGESEDAAAGHLGSNLERVVRSSQYAVLIVPAEVRAFQHFVIAYDGSANGDRMVSVLTQEPLLTDATCTLLMVRDAASDVVDQFEHAASQLRDAGYQVDSQLLNGHADEIILDMVRSSNADLLVMGAYGHSRIRSFLIGSTTTALLRESPVPVLVIR